MNTKNVNFLDLFKSGVLQVQVPHPETIGMENADDFVTYGSVSGITSDGHLKVILPGISERPFIYPASEVTLKTNSSPFTVGLRVNTLNQSKARIFHSTAFRKLLQLKVYKDKVEYDYNTMLSILDGYHNLDDPRIQFAYGTSTGSHKVFIIPAMFEEDSILLNEEGVTEGDFSYLAQHLLANADKEIKSMFVGLKLSPLAKTDSEGFVYFRADLTDFSSEKDSEENQSSAVMEEAEPLDESVPVKAYLNKLMNSEHDDVLRTFYTGTIEPKLKKNGLKTED